MTLWTTTINKKIKLNKPILIEGMPGIGSVGKITVDIIIEQVKAEKIASLFSHCLPNSVFVKEDNLVELPKIGIYHAKIKKQDYLFLAGDVQPAKEEDSYAFAETVLAFAKKAKCKEVIALGGIGLAELPTESHIFVTGNDKTLIQEWIKLGANNKLYGVVGPIMGITGLTLGLGKKYNLKCAALLAETYASQMHIGLREAKGLIKAIDKKYKMGLNIAAVEKDIVKFEKELKPVVKQQEIQEHKDHPQDTSYIG